MIKFRNTEIGKMPGEDFKALLIKMTTDFKEDTNKLNLIQTQKQRSETSWGGSSKLREKVSNTDKKVTTWEKGSQEDVIFEKQKQKYWQRLKITVLKGKPYQWTQPGRRKKVETCRQG